METFSGKVHLPGTDGEWDLQLEIEWNDKEVNVHIDQAPDGITDWPGLAVQTFGLEEIVFRTKGIPRLFTHWWHFVRGGSDELWGMVMGLPDAEGIWRTCPVSLERAKE